MEDGARETKIALTQGVVALVDDVGAATVGQFRWFAVKFRHHWYAQRHEPMTRRSILMHRQIAGAITGQLVDHVRHFPAEAKVVDNRRANLRIVTEMQNQQNGDKRRTAVWSKFKGVTFSMRNNKWKAQIKVNRKQTALGYFEEEIAAAHAYDFAAVNHFGIHARTNFPTAGAGSWIYGEE